MSNENERTNDSTPPFGEPQKFWGMPETRFAW